MLPERRKKWTCAAHCIRQNSVALRRSYTTAQRQHKQRICDNGLIRIAFLLTVIVRQAAHACIQHRIVGLEAGNAPILLQDPHSSRPRHLPIVVLPWLALPCFDPLVLLPEASKRLLDKLSAHHVSSTLSAPSAIGSSWLGRARHGQHGVTLFMEYHPRTSERFVALYQHCVSHDLVSSRPFTKTPGAVEYCTVVLIHETPPCPQGPARLTSSLACDRRLLVRLFVCLFVR